ncbi:hypothetical protein O164_17455 [Pseudomonas taiwanensis SJ9]|uniref:Uncharacterized protein n=1 Tax=Pseudomonas taiwanensis SJ9 TaxID=1388762 RepID=V7DAG5_9PSED|nr:hypothetical protein O164_17455 [Pseudomonas taiwanensis SJ9]
MIRISQSSPGVGISAKSLIANQLSSMFRTGALSMCSAALIASVKAVELR